MLYHTAKQQPCQGEMQLNPTIKYYKITKNWYGLKSEIKKKSRFGILFVQYLGLTAQNLFLSLHPIRPHIFGGQGQESRRSDTAKICSVSEGFYGSPFCYLLHFPISFNKVMFSLNIKRSSNFSGLILFLFGVISSIKLVEKLLCIAL